jgi:integrase
LETIGRWARLRHHLRRPAGCQREDGVNARMVEGGVTAYTLRHTAASWLVSKGKVADFLGTSEPMIRDHYGHLAPDYQDEAARAIGRK